MDNLVSIITPSYNSAKFIKESIESVIAQTYKNWEMIIVDDCSKDNSTEIIESFVKKDKRIKLIRNSQNLGAAETRNVALRKSLGKYVAFLDSDDVWYPQKLEKQLYFMKKNKIAFSFTSYEVIYENSSPTNKIIRVPLNISYNQYLKNTIIGCLTVLINREEVGYFEMPNIRSSHDMALWLLIMKRGFIAHGLNENLAKYRLVGNSNTSKKSKAAKDVWKVYREIEKLSLLRSSICFSNYVCNAIIKRI